MIYRHIHTKSKRWVIFVRCNIRTTSDLYQWILMQHHVYHMYNIYGNHVRCTSTVNNEWNLMSHVSQNQGRMDVYITGEGVCKLSM
jgi:hypothetical protein